MRKHRGFTLIEFILVAGLAMLVTIAGFKKVVEDLENQQATVAGEQIQILGSALSAFMTANSAALGAAANTAVTIAQLQAANLLSPTFSTTNAWGSNYTILVNRISAAPVQIEALITTNTPITDAATGNPRLDLVGIAALKAGAGGGMTYDATAASGVNAGWSALPATFPGITAAGQLAYYIGVANANDNLYLRRDGTNSMLANLNMGNNGIVSATNITGSGALAMTGNISGSAISGASLSVTGNAAAATMSSGSIALSTVVVANAACATNGTLARDANGAVLSCVSGQWRQGGSEFWRDPVADFAALPMVGNAAGHTRIALDIGRAFTWNGASWQALAVDESGNLAVTGTVTMNDAVVSAVSGYTTQRLSSLLPRGVWRDTFVAVNGTSIPKPTCAAGGTQRIFFIPHNLDSTDGIYNFTAVDAGATWTASVTTGSGTPQPQGRALAMTACSF